MDQERQLSGLIERIYETALDQDLWATLLPDISAYFNADFTGIYTPELATGKSVAKTWVTDWESAGIKAYAEYYGTISTNFEILSTYPVGKVFTDQMVPDYDVYTNSEAYNDFLYHTRLNTLSM